MRRIAGLTAAAVALLGMTAALSPVPAGAAPARPVVSDLQLDVAGDNQSFRNGPLPAAFATAGPLGPGVSVATVVSAKNNSPALAGRLTLEATGVAFAEGGCVEPETEGPGADTNCRTGPGELRAALKFSVSGDPQRDGSFEAPMFTGTLDQLAKGVVVIQDMQPGAIWDFRLQLSLPGTAGNALMSDIASFGLRWTLRGPSLNASVEVSSSPDAEPATSDRASDDSKSSEVLGLLIEDDHSSDSWIAPVGALGLAVFGLISFRLVRRHRRAL